MQRPNDEGTWRWPVGGRAIFVLVACAVAWSVGLPGHALAQKTGVLDVSAERGRALDARYVSDTALASLVRAERSFMDDVRRRRLAGWVDGFGDSAATFPAGGAILVGRAVIRNRMTRTFADSSVHVAWHPTHASIARSGDLGYTYGYYRWTGRDSLGRAAPPEIGKYLTVWRRDPRGRWLVVADIGNAGPIPDRFFAADSTR